MKIPRKKRDDTSAAITQTLWLVLVCSALAALTAYASDPSWWSSPGTGSQGAVLAPQVTTNSITGVVTTNYAPNPYAVVTQGQLKQFTTRAVDYLNANLTNGAGTNLNTMMSNWAQDYATNGYNATNIKPSDYTAMNVGQLKYIGNKVWAPLVAAGYTNAAPAWLQQNTNSDNALANLGQLKEVFNFDLTTFGVSSTSGMSYDAWQIEYLGGTGNNPYSLDPSGDGLTLLQAWQQGINPNDFYHGALPVLQMVSGDGQVGLASQVLPNPLGVRVENQQGQAMTNAPLQFAVALGGGQIATTSTGALSGSINLRTDTNGLAQVYLAPAGATGTVNQVQVTAATGGVSASVTFTATVGSTSGSSSPTPGGGDDGPTTGSDPGTGPPASPTVTITTPFPYVPYGDDIVATDGTAPPYDATHIQISWATVSGADSYEVDRVDDLGTHEIYTGSDTSCTDSGLYSNVAYQYNVYAISGSSMSQPGTASYSVPLIAAIALNTIIDSDGDTEWIDHEGFDQFGFFSTVAQLQGADVPPDSWPGWSIAYKFIFNPSRTAGTFTWYDTGQFLGPMTSPTNQPTSTEIDADGISPAIPTLGVLVNYASGNIPATGSIDGPTLFTTEQVLDQVSGIWWAYYPGYEDETVSWTGSGSSHFSVAQDDGYGDLTPIDNGAIIYPATYSSNTEFFMVTPNLDTAQPGDSITITVADNLFGSQTFTYTYQPPPPPAGDYSMSVDEASGPKYRKIALNGLPMPDEKPQQTGETDQEQEETYVDALTIGLRHSTTDVYLPVSGSDFSISARRDFRTEVWNAKSGLQPHEEPDQPFGMCWSSNLAPNIHFVQSNNPQKTQPDQAIVTDETGAVHTFVIWHDSSGNIKFFPMPTAKNEQQTPNLETLTLTTAGTGTTLAVYTFTRKYGSTLTYQMTPLTLNIRENRIQGSPYSSGNTYARLTQAVDRVGNTINYQFDPANAYNLVPETISVANQPDTKISIEQKSVSQLFSGSTNTQNMITAIWDAKGNKTKFHYTQAASGDTVACYLDCVVAPDGATTKYAYDIASETDTTPQPATPTPPPFWHADLHSITDPLSQTYTFTYALDQSKDDYMNNPSLHVGYYTKCGLPRNVVGVLMPDGTTSTFVNSSVVAVNVDSTGALALANIGTSGALTFPGQHQVAVTDTTGFKRTYRFGTPQIVPLPALKTLYGSSNMSDSKTICYQSLNIDYGDSTAGTYLGTETFQFDITAGMALSQITDFSGNVTTFIHGDAWTAPADYRTIMTNTTINGYYGDPTSQTNALGHSKTFTYYGANRIMQTSTDENGNKTYNDIDSLGRRTTEKLYDSGSNLVQETEFVYGSSAYPGFMTQKTVDALGGSDPSWTHALVTQYVPDADGRVVQEIVDPSGLDLVTTYTYDANGNKLTAIDPKGNTTWFSYDKRNRLVTVTHADGSQKQMVYDSRGNKIKEYDENGIATLYQYDSLNRLITQARDMNGNGTIDTGTDLVTSYTYNAVNSKLTTTDPNGGVTTMAYDNLQRVTQITDALSNITQFTYGTNSGGNVFNSASFKPTHSVDPRGFTTDVTYDALYRPLTKAVQYTIGGSLSTTSTQYDNVGNAILATDPLGNQTRTCYDALNRPTKVIFADGSKALTAYTSTGFKWQVEQQVSGTGTSAVFETTQTQYDAAGRAIAVTAGYGTSAAATSTTTYDTAGNVAETVNPLGNKWDYAYDARNRKLQEFEPAVHDTASNSTLRPTLDWQYDQGGRVVAVIDARGNETDTVYDAANRVTDVNAPAVSISGGGTARPNTHTTYDKNGNVLTLRDPNTHTTTNTYDALNRLLTTTDAAGITVTNTYDQVGNKLTVADGKSQITTFAYDGLNRNTTVTDPASQVTTLTYDALNKTGRTDAIGQVTTYNYDVRNRLSNVTYTSSASANSQRNYAYDYVGNLLSVTEPSKTVANVAYTYDALNRTITETSQGETHAYVYDLAGNRLSTVYGGTSRTITSTYDALNRLNTMTESGRVTNYSYDLNGNITLKTAPNGDTEASVFDALNRATSEVTNTGLASLLCEYDYSYDLLGNVLTVNETYPSGLGNRTVTNTYDSINRLTVEAVTAAVNVTTTYVYDNANNRTSKAVLTGGTTVTTGYTYNSLNQLTGYGDGTRSVALTYDLDGNRATRVVTGGSDNGTDTYSYDFENRLIGLVKGTSGGAGTYAYTYDYRTRRIVRDETNAGGTITNLVFSGGTSVQEYDGTTPALTVEYIRGSDYGGGVGGILYTLRGGTPSYTHENKRGDVVAKTDSTGSLTYQAQYEAFGKQVATSGSTLDRQKSNSKDTDPTGLVDEGYRYRDLETGMFFTRDPAGFVDGPNLYTYVRQNPWTAWDPEGLNDTFGYNGPGESLIPDPKAGIEQASRGWAQAMDSSASIGSRSFGAFEGLAFSLDTAVGLIPGEGAAEHAVENVVKKEIEKTVEGEATHAAETTVTKSAKDVVNEQPRDSKGKWTSPGKDDAPPGKTGEQTILDKKGQVKNNKTVSGDEGNSKPDYINDTQIGEIKTSKNVSDTKQMRIQRQAAKDAGKDHVVDVGTNAKVSKKVLDNSKVVRHDEIGPSQ